MTPKEYANELVEKYRLNVSDYEGSGLNQYIAKQCALVAVNEMIEWCEFDVVSDITNQRYIDKLNYLDEVSKEIQLL